MRSKRDKWIPDNVVSVFDFDGAMYVHRFRAGVSNADRMHMPPDYAYLSAQDMCIGVWLDVTEETYYPLPRMNP